jgi:hypothetical protein
VTFEQRKDPESEIEDLRNVLCYVNLAKQYLEDAKGMISEYHPRISGRLQIIKEELLLLSVIIEHESGLIGPEQNSDFDTDPPEDTKIDNKIPQHIDKT